MSQTSLFPRGLWNVGFRYLFRHRWQSLLMIIGIALGVAVIVAIDLANTSASKAFELSTEALTGKATHQIIGGPQGIDERLYLSLRRSERLEQAAPMISEYVSSSELGDLPLQLLGVDPLVDAPFRGFFNGNSFHSTDDLTTLLTKPGAVLISANNAARFKVKIGDPLELTIEGNHQQAFIAGIISSDDSLTQRTLDGLMISDIATAQELIGKIGKLDWIDLILPSGDLAALNHIQNLLPQGYQVVPVAAKQGSVEQMTSAFQLNLSALSLLALVVGLFLIYNTMTFSIVQRRSLFGTLRCLGVTRREIYGLVLSEALWVGIMGSALGIGLGMLMGRTTINMVSQTINDLYFTTTVRSTGFPIESLIKGGMVGVLATLITAAVPAWEAATVQPRTALILSNLESKTRKIVAWSTLVGFGFIAIGLASFFLPSNNLFIGFGGTFIVVVGFALLSPITMVWLLRVVTPISGAIFGLVGRIAPRTILRSLSRTAVAIAALMVSVAVTIGVTLMINSFRNTVTIWLAQTIQSDIYISVPGFNANRSLSLIKSDIVSLIGNFPGVGRADLLRTTMVESSKGQVQLSATQNPQIGSERFFLSQTVPSDEVWQAMQTGGVLVSEPLARRLDLLNPGSQIMLVTPVGSKEFPVLGIYYDYASSEGAIMMALPVYRSIWNDYGVTAIGLRLLPGANVDEIVRLLQDKVAGKQELLIRPNQSLRQDVMDVFDRTFAITAALRILATVVAFIGILNTLLLLLMEKQREIGVLRALGLTGRQLWQMTLIETGLMGMTAGILAIPTGMAITLILIYVINQRSFGWTLQLSVQPGAFIQAIAISLLAALLAGLYPAFQMSRMMTADAIRNE